jgi:hypothetical protein
MSMKCLPRFLQIGRRGIFLLFFAALELVVGLGSIGQQLTDVQTANSHYLLMLMPLIAWYTVWTIAGLINLAAAFWRRLEQHAFFLGSMLSISFAVAALMAEIFYPPATRAWMATIVYGGLAIINQIVAGWDDPSRRIK